MPEHQEMKLAYNLLVFSLISIIAIGHCQAHCKCTKDMVISAQKQGVSSEHILMEQDGRDTSEQAENLKSLLNAQPFILCTSALYSPRATLIFRFKGMNPIPSPSNFLEILSSVVNALQPSRSAWERVNLVIHEYVGLLWLQLGQFLKLL
jgi:uncharacterized SAM-binding protein YcdF (DUF218 family)